MHVTCAPVCTHVRMYGWVPAVSVVSCRVRVLFLRVRGFSVHTVSDRGLGGKSPPQLPSLRGDSVHYSRTHSCSDLSERRSQEVLSLALSPWTFFPVMSIRDS